MIDETAAEIAAMDTHSSSTVAIKAARAFRELLDVEYATAEELVRDVDHNSKALRRANDSHASLENALREIERRLERGQFRTVAEAKRELEDAIGAVVADVERGKRLAAEHAAEGLDDGDTLLVHDYSTTVLAAIDRATQAGSHLEVYVTESRPRMLGRKTARALAERDLEVTLISDGAHAWALADCDAVLTGMTCIVEETLYNRIGTYAIASSAAHEEVRMTVVGSGAKIVDGGFRFRNDMRDGREIMREPTDAFEIANPVYDATPLELVDEIVTDHGAMTV